MIKDAGRLMRVIVAERTFSELAKGTVDRGELLSEEEAAGIITRAIENDPRLAEIGENHVGHAEAIPLAEKSWQVGRRRVRHELLRTEIRRTLERTCPKMLGQVGRMAAMGCGEADPHPGHDEAFVDGLLEELRERGEL